MDDITRILNSLGKGDTAAESELLEIIYAELHAMAAGKMVRERPGHTLQATALVNEAYLRLAGSGQDWQNRRHFFGAASEAMRRILVEAARKRSRDKRGGGQEAEPLDEEHHQLPARDERLLLIHEVLGGLEAEDPGKAQIVKLRYFVGLTHTEIGELLGINERTVRRHWDAAKIWLYRAIKDAI